MAADEKDIGNAKELLKLMEAVAKSEEERAIEAEKRAALTVDQVKKEEELARLSGDELERLKLRNKRRQAELEQQRNQHIMVMSQLRHELAALDKKDENGRRDLKVKYEAAKVLKEQIELQQKAADVIDQVGEKTSGFLTNLTGIGDQWKKGIIGGFIEVSQVQGGFKEALARSAEAMKKTMSLSNILGSSLQKMAESTAALYIEQDTAIASLRKATSTYKEYDDIVVQIERDNLGFGISTGDAAKSVQSLYTGMTNFVLLGPKVRSQLAQTTARLEKLGVAAETTTAVMEIATRVLGMTGAAAANLSLELAASAEAMSMPINAFTENFVKSMPILAKWGSQAVPVFKKVQAASRSLGIEVNQLLDIVGKFDTFEGAAEAAGKLNTILGGNLLNSTELVLANEAERVKMIQKTIVASGRSWESMNRHEKQSVATALGISDMTVASKLMTEGLGDFTKGIDKHALSEEEVKKRMDATRSITEKLTEVWRMFAVSLQPLVGHLHNIVNWIYELNRSMDNYLVPSALALLGVIKLLGFSFGSLTGGIGLLARKIPGVANLQDKLSEGMSKAGKAAKMSAGHMLAMGAAVLMIGAGIGAAAYGVSLLVAAFKGLGKGAWAATVAIGVLMIPFIAFMALMAVLVYTGVGVGAAGVIGAIGVGMLLMGVGIALAADGMVKLVKTLGSMGTEAMEVVKAMGLLSLSIIPFALFGLLAAIGIGAFAVGLLAVAGALALIKTDDLEYLSSMMTSMGNMPVDIGTNLLGAGKGLVSVAEASDKINEDGAESITKIFKSLTAYHAEIKVGAPPTLAPVTAGSSPGKISAKKAPPTTFTFEVEGRELARIVATHLDIEMDTDIRERG